MNNKHQRHPELLIPASNLEVLKTAVIFGADAVYIGGEAFGLRAKAKNFSMEDMQEGIRFAHAHNAKVYVTANILAHNEDLEGIREYFQELSQFDPKPDALIISDPGVFEIATEICPDIERHISTQANNTNYGTYNFWHRMGASRVVTARELSLKEIKELREKIPAELEIETFVHGAMCISYSGRCLLSSYFTSRDANRGACTHPCRWKYHLVEEQRPGEYLPVYENERGTYIMNSKDLCMIEHIPELVEAGIDSFKIEGRMKNALYVATVARTYRRAIDDYLVSRDLYERNLPWYLDQISNCTYRQFTTGFFFGKAEESAQIYDNNTYIQEYIYLGIVGDVVTQVPVQTEGVSQAEDELNLNTAYQDSVTPMEENVDRRFYHIEQRNKFTVGDIIEVMKPDGSNVDAKVLRILDHKGIEQESCPHSRQELYIELDQRAEQYDILRMQKVND